MEEVVALGLMQGGLDVATVSRRLRREKEPLMSPLLQGGSAERRSLHWEDDDLTGGGCSIRRKKLPCPNCLDEAPLRVPSSGRN